MEYIFIIIGLAAMAYFVLGKRWGMALLPRMSASQG